METGGVGDPAEDVLAAHAMNTFALKSGLETRPRYHARSNRWVSRFFTLAAAVIVVTIHLGWILAASGRVSSGWRPERSRSRVPEVAFLGPAPVAPGQQYDDVRVIESPVLMSLPTGIGFSGPLAGSVKATQTPLFKDEPTVFLRSPSAPFAVDPYGETLRKLGKTVTEPRMPTLPPTDPMPQSELGAAPAESRILMYWADRSGVPVAFPGAKVPEWAGTQPWEAVLFVSYSPDGWISHVMLEKPTPSKEANDNLLRMVRASGIEPPGATGQARLVVRFMPAGKAEGG